MQPQSAGQLLLENVELLMVTVPPLVLMSALPKFVPKLNEKVEKLMVSTLLVSLSMAPPSAAELAASVQLFRTLVPELLKMAPPRCAELPVLVVFFWVCV